MSSIIQALQKALETNPADWETRLALAEALIHENQADQALATLEQAEQPPADPNQHLALARCYAALDPDKARAVLSAILEVDPANPDATDLVNALDEAAREGETEPDPEPVIPVPLSITAADTVDDDEDKEDEADEDKESPADDSIPGPAAAAIPPPKVDIPAPPVDIPAPETESDSEPEPAVGENVIVLERAHVDEDADAADDPIKSLQDEAAHQRKKDLRAAKVKSLFATGLLHVAAILLLSLVVIAVPKMNPPEIVAVAAPTMEMPTPETKKVETPTLKKTETSAAVMPNIINSLNISEVSIPSVQNAPEVDSAVFGSSFTPSLSFGPAGQIGQPMLFGEPIEGKTLGVILDVSGSMSEFLPKVIREIDRNFEKASIVFVYEAIMRTSDSGDTEIRPIATDDVVPMIDGLRTPYWFLWHDLPRKAEQSAVDRLIDIFKTRQNSYMAIGRNEPVTAAMDYLRGLGIDALYIFSDFEDFVDADAAVENARELSKAGIKTYVQPAQVQTEYLEIVSSKIADRTDGKELPPLISLDVPDEEEPAPLLAAVSDPVEVKVEGVNYATPRAERIGTEWYEYRSPGKDFEIIEVFEHPKFDLVLYGPAARADIYLKSEEGYIMRPIRFWWHSRKWFLNERGDLTWRRRHWLRNQEPPKLDGNEITWKMIIEDELEFDVWFVFDDNTFMATYSAEEAPEEFERRHDDASVTFLIPPLAVQKDDIYYSADFPEGRNLDDLRLAAAPNTTLFNLSTAEADRYETQWNLYGFQRGKNERTHDVLCKRLPNGILNAVVQGPSFGPRILTVAGRQNDILLNAHGHRADIELWEGYSIRLTRPRDGTRHRLTKTEAFQLTID
ncbi:MAG: tetratricopeptide repeat protein [Verrucomicrobiota bacterium]